MFTCSEDDGHKLTPNFVLQNPEHLISYFRNIKSISISVPNRFNDHILCGILLTLSLH